MLNRRARRLAFASVSLVALAAAAPSLAQTVSPADTAAADGAYVVAPFSAEDPRPEARRFVEAFRKRYGVLRDGNAAMGYDATMVIARAIAEVGPSRGTRNVIRSAPRTKPTANTAAK